MRRWLWPYALLAIFLTIIGVSVLGSLVSDLGGDRLGAQFVAANALVIEPAKGVLISLLELVAPFEVPLWVKNLYANLVVIAAFALALSCVVGLLLLPIFYAVYRGNQSE